MLSFVVTPLRYRYVFKPHMLDIQFWTERIKICTYCYLWSKTTLITGGVEGADSPS